MAATVAGLLLSNSQLLPSSAPLYSEVQRTLLPVSVSCLLFAADIRRVLRDAGITMLGAFAVASVATFAGTLGAMSFITLSALGDQAWRVASALLARHIGGAQNYIAVCDALNVSSSVVSAGLAASNCMCIIFFSFIFYLGGPPVQPSVEKCGFQRSGKMTQAARSEQKNAESSSADFKEVLYALSTSSVLCAISNGVARHLGKPGWTLWIVSLLTVMIASVYPAGLARLKAGGEILASVFLQMFFCVVGLSAHIPTLLSVGPQLFLFSIVQIAIHLSIVLAVWSLSGKISKREALVASNAAVGGPTTALALCASKGWDDLRLPGILVGILGSASATLCGISLGPLVLQPLFSLRA